MNGKVIIYFFLSVLVLTSCFDEDHYENTKRDNFEALWKIMDQKYCFFEYKDVDWNDVYSKYSPQVNESMTNDELFTVLGNMLAEVKDGHVNLIANHDVARYWKWYEDYPDNFDEKIQRNYIGTDYSIAGGMKYKVLPDSIGYIYYGSFSSALGSANLDQVLYRMAKCKGIIVDVRDNGGGMLTYAERFASRFFTEKTLVSFIMHKTGTGHNDFSTPYERYIEPSSRVRYLNQVVVLTNRRSYSATNDFVNAMTYAPNVVIMGDKTGGGSGLPFSSELPNGWLVRFSASPMLNANKEQIEFGIDPDIKVGMTDEDMVRGVDTMIEAARKYIKER